MTPPRGRIRRQTTAKERMERKLLTRRGRAAYRKRGATIEAVFGQMATQGLNRFLLRGVAKVKAELSLWCTSHNLLKLWRAHIAAAGLATVGAWAQAPGRPSIRMTATAPPADTIHHGANLIDSP